MPTDPMDPAGISRVAISVPLNRFKSKTTFKNKAYYIKSVLLKKCLLKTVIYKV